MKISTRGYVNEDLLWAPETLSKRMNRPGLTIIDTRPAELFAKGHISGAKHLFWHQEIVWLQNIFGR